MGRPQRCWICTYVSNIFTYLSPIFSNLSQFLTFVAHIFTCLSCLCCWRTYESWIFPSLSSIFPYLSNGRWIFPNESSIFSSLACFCTYLSSIFPYIASGVPGDEPEIQPHIAQFFTDVALLQPCVAYVLPRLAYFLSSLSCIQPDISRIFPSQSCGSWQRERRFWRSGTEQRSPRMGIYNRRIRIEPELEQARLSVRKRKFVQCRPARLVG